jgi:hypothetical protein
VKPDQDSLVIEERATRNWVGADLIVRSQIKGDIDFSLEDSVAALAATRRLAKRLPFVVLVDCRQVRSASRESRLYWEGREARESLAAMALLVASPVSRVIASFFVRLVRPEFNVRLFSSEDDAVRWLRQIDP